MGIEKFYNRDSGEKWGHPEILAAYDMMAGSIGYAETLLNDHLPIEERREFMLKAEADFAKLVPPVDPARTTTHECPGCADEPDAPLVKLHVSRPTTPRAKKNLPCILVIPGGGLATCFQSTPCEAWSDKYGVVVAQVMYRTVITGKGYPEPLNDCEAAYNFLVEHAAEFNISPKKIILHGNSSGGHLALALAHRLKRRGITPRGALVWVPILDDRPTFYSSHIDSAFWGQTSAAASARCYLGDLMGTADVSPEAYPNRATVEECVGLCPTFIHAMMNDVGLGSQMEYAAKLTAAGVYTEIHCWGGSQHCSLTTAAKIDANDPDDKYAQIFNAVQDKEYEDLFKYDLTRPWTLEEFNEE